MYLDATDIFCCIIYWWVSFPSFLTAFVIIVWTFYIQHFIIVSRCTCTSAPLWWHILNLKDRCVDLAHNSVIFISCSRTARSKMGVHAHIQPWPILQRESTSLQKDSASCSVCVQTKTNTREKTQSSYDSCEQRWRSWGIILKCLTFHIWQICP